MRADNTLKKAEMSTGSKRRQLSPWNKDHWLRLRVRLGANVPGVCPTSHQHAMTLKDFCQQVDTPLSNFAASGYHLIERTDGWYQVCVNKSRMCLGSACSMLIFGLFFYSRLL